MNIKNLFKKDSTIDVVGTCANCGVEYHIHKNEGDNQLNWAEKNKAPENWRELFKNEEINHIFNYMNIVNQKFFNVTGHIPSEEQKEKLLRIRQLLVNTIGIMNQKDL